MTTARTHRLRLEIETVSKRKQNKTKVKHQNQKLKQIYAEQEAKGEKMREERFNGILSVAKR